MGLLLFVLVFVIGLLFVFEPPVFVLVFVLALVVIGVIVEVL